QHRLAAESIREASREVVGCSLDDAEDDDEGENRGSRGEVELPLGERRQDGALEPNHGADEGVDDDQQGELRQVCNDAQPWRRAGRVLLGHTCPRLAARIWSIPLGGGSIFSDIARMKASRSRESMGFQLFSKASVELGLP